VREEDRGTDSLSAVPIPLAVSDAVVTGAAAVLGALVGVCAGGVVDAILEGRRERASAKAGARLVANDIQFAATALKKIEDGATWFPLQPQIGMVLQMVAWPEYRDVLARRLSNEQFDSVSKAVTGVVNLMQVKKGQPLQLNPNTVMQARQNLTDAYNALAELGGQGRVEGLPDERPTG
jgi:hypothetical protein